MIERRVKALLPDAAAEQLAAWSRRSDVAYRARVAAATKDADAVLVSFPKVGRTWLRVLIGKAFQERYELRTRQLLRVTAGRVVAEGMPRIVSTHDDATQDKPARDVIANKSAYRNHRVLFMVRDPRDVIVSHYFHQTKRRADPYERSLAEFLREPNGSLDTIIAFYNVWAAQRHVPAAFHLLRYEDLKADTEGALRQVLDFLGADGISDRAVRRAVEFASFERSQQREREQKLDLKALRAWDPDDEDSFKARRGVVGGYVDYLSDEQIAEMNQRLASLNPLYGYDQAPGPPS